MSTVYFSNPGHIDLDVIRTMGVSVKGNKNPIGYFGTGLKFAIATLLRNEHEIVLHTNNRTIKFSTGKKTIRGAEFNMIYMDDEQLGFTTDLGKNWEVWQAYRELYSNAMDEMGSVGRIFKNNDTVFIVKGHEIGEAHENRGKIFLQNEPWIVGDGIEVHRGKSEFVYYRGVRVHKLPKLSRFTYNLTCHMMLTEDRTLASNYDMAYKLGTRLPRIPDHSFASKIVDPEWEGFENALDFSDCGDPSEEFLDVLEKYRSDARMSDRLKGMLMVHRVVSEWDEFNLDEGQMQTVREACDMLRSINCIVYPRSFVYVENLGPGVYAQAKNNSMYITRQAIANGRDFLAITMYEEWIHDTLGYQDESRGMQQFLFDKILELIKRESNR